MSWRTVFAAVSERTAGEGLGLASSSSLSVSDAQASYRGGMRSEDMVELGWWLLARNKKGVIDSNLGRCKSLF